MKLSNSKLLLLVKTVTEGISLILDDCEYLYSEETSSLKELAEMTQDTPCKIYTNQSFIQVMIDSSNVYFLIKMKECDLQKDLLNDLVKQAEQEQIDNYELMKRNAQKIVLDDLF